jgi:uncharacterized membrane protein YkoI
MRLFISLLLAIVFGSFAPAAEKRIKKTDLPPAVLKTAEEQAKGASVKGYTKETEDGQTFYEVETVAGGRIRDILIDTSGKLVEVEEQRDLGSVPAPVKAALQKSGKVLKVESVTRRGTVTYEAVVQSSGKKSEVNVDAGGRILSK